MPGEDKYRQAGGLADVQYVPLNRRWSWPEHVTCNSVNGIEQARFDNVAETIDSEAVDRSDAVEAGSLVRRLRSSHQDQVTIFPRQHSHLGQASRRFGQFTDKDGAASSHVDRRQLTVGADRKEHARGISVATCVGLAAAGFGAAEVECVE